MPDSDQIKVNAFVENQLDRLAGDIEKRLDADVMAIMGPIYPGERWDSHEWHCRPK